MRRVALICLALLMLLPAGALGLTVSEVGEELRCVTCGTPLNVSNAPAAQRMKDRIAQRIAEGASKQQIIDEFVADFGRPVLATPKKSGFDLWAAWILPIGALLVGLAAVPFMTRALMRRRRGGGDDTGAETLSPEDQARLDRELEAYGDG